MKKRELVMMLVVVLSLSLLMGCGKDDSEATSSTADVGKVDVSFPLSEPVTVTAFAIMNGEHSLGSTLFMKEMTEKTNIHWDIQDASGIDILEKRNLLIGTNDYPDVFIKSAFSTDDANKYGAQGVFIPLQDLIKEYAPNIQKLLDERDGMKEIITSADGNIYALPEVGIPIPEKTQYYLNYQWLENLNLEEPTSLDELYDVLKAFKRQDANGNGDSSDEIPFIATKSSSPTTASLFSTYVGVPTNKDGTIALMDDEWVYFPATEEYKELLAFITKLYSDGLMHPDSFTMENPQMQAIGKSADILGSFFNMGAFLTVTHENSVQYDPLTPFESNSLFANAGVWAGTFMITDACENPEEVMAWVDYLYSEEGAILSWLGVEGETYEVTADGTWDWILPDGKTITNVRWENTLQGSANHPSLQPRLWSKINDVYAREIDREREQLVVDGSIGVFVPPNLTAKESTKVASIKADVDIYIEQYMAQVATGALDLEESWDEYLETLDAMGANEMFEIYKAALEK